MKVTYVEAAGLSLDVLRKVEPHEEISIEPELFLDIPPELFDRWQANYLEAAAISTQLYKLRYEGQK